MLEGFSSTIRRDGSQPMRYAVRNDCTTEVAMLLALDAAVNGRPENARRAANLVDYIFGNSGLAAGTAGRSEEPVVRPGGLGPGSSAARTGATTTPGRSCRRARWRRCPASGGGTSRSPGAFWPTSAPRACAASAPSCVEEKDLQARGWKAYWTSRHVHYSPHMQSWLWACNLWAYQQTRFEPLLARSKTGMRLMMQAYPARWDWILRSGTIERSRLLLPLAWLVRVDDTPEHRRWLRQIADDLVALQDRCGALREVIGDGGPGHSARTPRTARARRA